MSDEHCVVCGTRVDEAHYANAWEKVRMRYPCCSDACVARFDPIEHWIPARFPEPASDEDRGRLLAVARKRLGAGDEPSIVVRELLVAGIPVLRVRGVLIDVGSNAEREQREKRWVNAALLIVTGRWMRFRTDRRNVKKIAAAHADIALWERRSGAQ